MTGTFRGFELAMHDPGIALITFNQPDRLNGMTQGMKRDLIETILQAQMDDARARRRVHRLRTRVLGRRRHHRAAAARRIGARRSCRRSAPATTTRSARTTGCARCRSR